jgi:DNA-binding CsgD family transcriptional regulator/pimeloyl-ACP methyl ester carboxylesterase
MEPPPVQYATTIDGYSIACLAVGEGMPFVYVPGQFSSLIDYPHDRNDGPWTAELASRFRLVRYDGRGQGMSTRGLREPSSIGSLDHDLEAVVEELHLEGFILFARWYMAHTAVRYAVANPGRLVAMILDGCSEDNSRWPSSVYTSLPDENWEVFLLSQMPKDLTMDDARVRIAEINRAITPADRATRAKAFIASSVAGLLPLVRVPTLVMHPRDYLMIPASESMKVASQIPGARFVYINGQTLPGDTETGVAAIDAFITELADQRSSSGGTKRPAARLSLREAEILRLMSQGLSNQQMADELVLSVRTVERHINHIYAKLGVRNRAQAAAYAVSRTLA